MNKYDVLREKNNAFVTEGKLQAEYFEDVANEYERVEAVYKNVNIVLSDIDNKFAEATKLNKTDIAFLFFATALQCVRQYLLTDFKERVDDKEAAERVSKEKKQPIDRIHNWYHPSLEEIQTNPVPYDAMFGSPVFGLDLSGKSHRFKTLGHDPLLGWVFGTANIVTSTLTMWNLSSFHVKTDLTGNGLKRDKIISNADTSKVFTYTKERLIDEGKEGKIAVGSALIKQGNHIRSDIGSKAGIPIPIISSISPELAQQLAEYGIDAGNILNVGKQASYTMLINMLIAMIHGLFYDKKKFNSWSLYEVKTRKILTYSNSIASMSNVIVVSLGAAMGILSENPDLIRKSLRKLDVGGILVTIYRLITDINFINMVKQEFLENEWYDLVVGKEYEFMKENKHVE